MNAERDFKKTYTHNTSLIIVLGLISLMIFSCKEKAKVKMEIIEPTYNKLQIRSTLDSLLTLFIEENIQAKSLYLVGENTTIYLIASPENMDERYRPLMKWKYKGKEIAIDQGLDYYFRNGSSTFNHKEKKDSIIIWELDLSIPYPMIPKTTAYVSKMKGKDLLEKTYFEDDRYEKRELSVSDTFIFDTKNTEIDNRLDSLLNLFMDSIPTIYQQGRLFSTYYFVPELYQWRVREDSTSNEHRIHLIHLDQPSSDIEFELYNPYPLFQFNHKGHKIFIRSALDYYISSDMEKTHLFINDQIYNSRNVIANGKIYDVDGKNISSIDMGEGVYLNQGAWIGKKRPKQNKIKFKTVE